MLDLAAVTAETFTPCIGEPFVVQLSEGALALELADVAAAGPRAFSLLFHGPLAPLLPQGTYPLTNAVSGELALFLVPVGPQAGAMRYEAVFT